MEELHFVPQISGRLIRCEKRRDMPKRWICFDTETLARDECGLKTHYFTMGWTCLCERWSRWWPPHREWRYWEDEEKMCRYFHDMGVKHKELYVFAHNIFFDLQGCGFFAYMREWGWTLDFVYDKGLTYILKISHGKKTMTLLSTTNWFDESLEKVGDMLGVPKLKVDFRNVTREKLSVYCRRDTEIVVRAMDAWMRFVAGRRLGRFSLTKSSQALTAYRHRFMDVRIRLHRVKDIVQLERDAYMGGRTEAFHLGEVDGGPFVTLDINSMYPYVMKRFRYPCELVDYGTPKKPEDLADVLRSWNVIADADIETDEPAYAVQRYGKTIFPVGRFRTALCSEGLKYALARGHVKYIRQIAYYRSADLFTDYVNYFHRLRTRYKKDNNLIMSKLCKYMHNSLYGKFGQKKVMHDMYDEFTGRGYFREEIVNIDTGDVTIITKLMNKIVVTYQEEEGPFSFPAIAAHITENGRMVLWNIIRDVGPERVLYCDTDSIKIRERDLAHVRWPLSRAVLGALKVETVSERLYIGGAKNYRDAEGRHIKGIPAEAAEFYPGYFEYETFVRQDGHLRKEKVRGVMTRVEKRYIAGDYDKGLVGPDGRVIPFSLSEF